MNTSITTCTEAVTAIYNTGFSNTIVVIKPTNKANEIRVVTYTKFTDNSGRFELRGQLYVQEVSQFLFLNFFTPSAAWLPAVFFCLLSWLGPWLVQTFIFNP